jgi:hypothetical protein
LQDPGWHRFRCGYPAPGTSNGDGFPAQVDPVLSYRSRPPNRIIAPRAVF